MALKLYFFGGGGWLSATSHKPTILGAGKPTTGSSQFGELNFSARGTKVTSDGQASRIPPSPPATSLPPFAPCLDRHLIALSLTNSGNSNLKMWKFGDRPVIFSPRRGLVRTRLPAVPDHRRPADPLPAIPPEQRCTCTSPHTA